jgi:hypothetical protein
LKRLKANKSLFLAAVLFIASILYADIRAMDYKDRDSNTNNPFGILEFLHWNHAWNNYKYPTEEELTKAIALMKEAGVGCVRMDFLWDDIEPKEGVFSFAKYDTVVDLLSGNNIDILGLLNYSASWALSCEKWNCPPSDFGLFVNYAVKVAQRYKGKIKYWEVWNEPDSGVYWSVQDGLKSYCSLLKDVYAALKEIDPECKVLNGGLANGPISVNRLYDNGAKDYFDILNIHIFENPLNAVSIKAVTAHPKLAYKIMSRNGDAHKKIWVTEIGCPGVKRGQKAKNWWAGKNPSERQQAKWVEDIYNQLLKNPAVEKVFWAFFRDCKEHWKNGTDYFGIVRWDFSKKRAFSSYQKCFKRWKKSEHPSR